MKFEPFIMGILMSMIPVLLQGQDNISPLKIGDPVPDIGLEHLINYPQPTAQFSDFKDQLLILDFWATWCSPCVRAIPHLEQLQREYGNDLRVLLVTSQDKNLIAPFLAKRNITLPCVVNDQFLSALFPHQFVPHEVWIKDGNVFAITSDAEVTAANIKDVLSGTTGSFPEKKSNFDYDHKKPLLIGDNGGKADDLMYHSVITGYLDGIGGGGVYTDSLNRYKIRALNGNVVQLYQTAIRYTGNIPLTYHNRNILECDEKEILPPSQAPAYSPAVRDQYYSYELIVPSGLKEKAAELMLEDLNRFFGAIYGIQGGVEKRTVSCWVLKKKDPTVSLLSKSAIPEIRTDESHQLVYRKQPFRNFYHAVVSLYRNEPCPIIDQTGITSEIDITFPTREKDLFKFKAYLNRYGLDLEQELCETDMLVIKKIN
ncbi:MAG: TlpA family protein disulfide reductase [Mangrovibacterium sp.]